MHKVIIGVISVIVAAVFYTNMYLGERKQLNDRVTKAIIAVSGVACLVITLSFVI